MPKANVVTIDRNTFPAVTMMPLSTLKPAADAPRALGLQVRKSSDAEGLPTLEASVRTHGVIVPLVVQVHHAVRYVVAGNRRLKVLKQIHGDIDVMVPVIHSTDFDGDNREIAMATNVALPPHPVDRYEVIAALVKEGMTPEDAKLRFGLDDKQFRQIMKLGLLSEGIRDKWRAGEITGEVAQAFTLAEPKDQDRIFKQVAKEAYDNKIYARNVISRIVPESQREAGRLVEFVGINRCEKLGILKERDLFGSNHIAADVKELKKVAQDLLDEMQGSLIAEGWAWAEMRDSEPHAYTFSHIAPDKKGRFSKEQMAKAGCFMFWNHEGKFEIDKGRVRPAERKKADAAMRKAASPKGEKKAKAEVSNALGERLAEQLRAAGAEVLKFDHKVAVSALIAAFASGTDVINVFASGAQRGKSVAFESVFETAMKASPEQRNMMLAQIAALALQPSHLDRKGFAALFGAMAPTTIKAAVMAAFDAKDYFDSVPLALCVEAVSEAMGKDHAAKVAKMKKPEAAKFAVANVPKTGWLPKQLRTHLKAKGK